VDPLDNSHCRLARQIARRLRFCVTSSAEEAAIAPTRCCLAGRIRRLGRGAGLPATGFFRAVKRTASGVVTPSGHLFLSFGLNAITAAEGDTITEGREEMFQWLPAKGDPLATHYRENAIGKR